MRRLGFVIPLYGLLACCTASGQSPAPYGVKPDGTPWTAAEIEAQKQNNTVECRRLYDMLGAPNLALQQTEAIRVRMNNLGCERLVP